ncbi:hypothetical protein F4703DRAFT_1872100 [Phycomyces blakesleeanus]
MSLSVKQYALLMIGIMVIFCLLGWIVRRILDSRFHVQLGHLGFLSITGLGSQSISLASISMYTIWKSFEPRKRHDPIDRMHSTDVCL